MPFKLSLSLHAGGPQFLLPPDQKLVVLVEPDQSPVPKSDDHKSRSKKKDGPLLTDIVERILEKSVEAGKKVIN